MNDKFTEAQPEAIVGKWFCWGTIGKADLSDRWPTVTPQLANVGPTIVCYMGSISQMFVCVVKRISEVYEKSKYLTCVRVPICLNGREHFFD